MITGKITEEDYERQYVNCKNPGCVYVAPLDAGLELKKSDREKCKACGWDGVVKESNFMEVGKNV